MRRLGAVTDPAAIGYLTTIHGIAQTIPSLRAQQNARVAAYMAQARALKVDDGWLIANVLAPWNGWDEHLSDLEGRLIPLEILRVQEHGGAIGSLTQFHPPAAPVLPPFPSSTLPTSPKPGTGPTTPVAGDPGGPATGGSFPTTPKDPKPGTGQPSPVTPVLGGLSLNTWAAIAGGAVLLFFLSRD